MLTPETRDDLERASKKWHQDVTSKYDLKALHVFLKESISTTKRINDLEVNTIDFGTKFSRRDSFSLGAGRWLFVTKDPKAGAFELRALDGSRGWAVFVCERESKAIFRVVKTYIDSTIQLCPPPYTFSP